MNDQETNFEATVLANRAAIIGTCVLESLAVGALAIYAAYCEYWQWVVVAVGYLAYVAFKVRYDLRKVRADALADSDRLKAGEPSNETLPAGGANSTKDVRWIKSTPQKRKLAGVLALVYIALMATAFYLESIHIEDRWPTWILWIGGVTGFATLLVLPFAVIGLLFGIDLTVLVPRRFTIRGMLRGMFWASLLFWYSTQMYWIIQRGQWRTANRQAVASTEGDAPPALRLLRERGESRIELMNATQEKIAEAKRLFPEAEVVAAETPAVGGQSLPVIAPAQP